jgi:HEAT repeat protein
MSQTYVLWVCAAALVGAAVLVGVFALRPKAVPEQKPTQERSATHRTAAAKKPVKRAGSRTRQGVATGRVVRAGSYTTNRVAVAAQAVGRTEDERKATEMRDLLDSGHEREALQMARALMASPEAAVRSQVVTVLGWIGVKALPELTEMLADGEDYVADDALTQWKMAFDEIEGEAAKAELLVAAIGSLKKVEDMEALVMSFGQLPEGMAIRSLVQVIQSGNELAAGVAREQYEFTTGDAFTTAEAALALAEANDREDAGLQQ